jgi:hypothetical protein
MSHKDNDDAAAKILLERMEFDKGGYATSTGKMIASSSSEF